MPKQRLNQKPPVTDLSKDTSLQFDRVIFAQQIGTLWQDSPQRGLVHATTDVALNLRDGVLQN